MPKAAGRNSGTVHANMRLVGLIKLSINVSANRNGATLAMSMDHNGAEGARSYFGYTSGSRPRSIGFSSIEVCCCSVSDPNHASLLATTTAYTTDMPSSTEARNKSTTGSAHHNKTIDTAENNASRRKYALFTCSSPLGATMGHAPVITSTLKIAEPTIVPMPTDVFVTKMPHTLVSSSGPLHAKATSVAPATSSGIPKCAQIASTVGTK
mmetsp:Transcript_51274/g.129427  ORF Transcript_51274/g.129427 Transcript_51274/m.129427 type:complete len:210 (+) Transcript_51274:509-1138(+)